MTIKQNKEVMVLEPNSTLRPRIIAVSGTLITIVLLVVIYIQSQQVNTPFLTYLIDGSDDDIISTLTVMGIPIVTILAIYMGWFEDIQKITIDKDGITMTNKAETKYFTWSQIQKVEKNTGSSVNIRLHQDTILLHIQNYVSTTNSEEQEAETDRVIEVLNTYLE